MASSQFAAPAGPGFDTGGRLIYAVGDIHGRDDLFARLLERIVADSATHAAAFDTPPVIVLLGDYVDRGATSRSVIDRAIALRNDPGFEVRCLFGNHEEAMLDFIDHRTTGVGWGRHGGVATLASYGVGLGADSGDAAAWSAARARLATAMPSAHRDFLRNLELQAGYGDLLFVHAGIRPGVPIERQDVRDLLWIRSEFFDHQEPLPKFVVHGHTPVDRAYLGPDRLCLDTGAYLTGRLTAARFDGGTPAIIDTKTN